MFLQQIHQDNGLKLKIFSKNQKQQISNQIELDGDVNKRGSKRKIGTIFYQLVNL